jgi:hypothetical protein
MINLSLQISVSALHIAKQAEPHKTKKIKSFKYNN